MPKLQLKNGVWHFRCQFEEREIAREAGMHFARDLGWHTYDLAVAVRLRQYAVGEAERQISRKLIAIEPWTLPLPPSPEGLQLKKYQRRAIKFALSRNSSYLRLCPGLGKTPISATVAATLLQHNRGWHTLFLCPPTLVENTRREFEKWAPQLLVGVYGEDVDPFGADVSIIPDSVLTPEMLPAISHRKSKRVLFVDEAHRFKSITAKRTQSLFGGENAPGLVDVADKRVFLSGTPMPNRPIELFPVLSAAAPETIDFMGEHDYGVKYCGGARTGYRGAWEYTGATNLDELAKRVIHPTGPFMLKMTKDLLKLPPKIEEVFTLNVPTKLKRALQDIEGDLPEELRRNPEEALKQHLRSEAGFQGTAALHISTYLRLLGVAKVEAAALYILDCLEWTDDAFIVYARHLETLQRLAKYFLPYTEKYISGETSLKERQEIIDEFQGNPKRRILLASYAAIGLGHTITKANRVSFVEFPWNGAVADQASDRAHRFGQSRSVLVEYLVFPNSLDSRVIQTVLRKRQITKHM